MFSKGIFLELQQLHHQPSQGFIGGSICLNVLQNKKPHFLLRRSSLLTPQLPAAGFWDPCMAGGGFAQKKEPAQTFLKL